MNRSYLLISLMMILAGTASAHQPVMDMAPRWENGFGFQYRYEYYGSDELLSGSSKLENPLGLKRHVERNWFEGVYTFDREARVTFKLPYVNQRRIVSSDGVGTLQKNEGIGDLILGIPLKSYKNDGGLTSNLSFTPSIRIPTGTTSGDFPISDGSWDLGLSVSYSTESPIFYQLYDLFYWINTNGAGGREEGDELGLDINWGIHPYHDNKTNRGMFLMLDVTARHNERGDALTTGSSGGERLQAGPVIVLYQDNIMVRGEYRYPIHEDVDGVSLSRGHEVNMGIGITF